MVTLRRTIVIGLLFITVLNVNGQANPFEIKDTIVERFLNQALLYPQEKIHLQIDKPHYLSGERIWLKAFLVDAMLHTPNKSSRYIYVELIDPMKQVKSRIKIRTENNSFQGYIDLPEDIIEGNYTIRAYTSYMKNWDEGYWPHMPIYISDPQAASINIASQFEHMAKGKASLDLSLTNVKDNTKHSPKMLSITYGGKELKQRENDSSLNILFEPKEGQNVLLVECDKYKKFVSIPNSQDDYEITFFPEGGNMIQETTNCIAFKSLYGNGNPVDVTGYIIDENENRITNFATYHDGMGLFFIKPETGIKYYAISKDKAGIERKFELPLSINGAGLRISNIKNNFFLSVSKSPDIATDQLYIVMHTRGILQYAEKWDDENNEVSFEKGMFLSGILHILLIDSKGQTLSERLIFCNNDDQAEIKKEISSNVKTRERVSVDLQISDKKDNLLSADLLISVTDDKDIDATINSSILSTLLLTSDIRGYIPHPNYYFEKNDPKMSKALDMLMLTHGWRRYNIPDIVRGKYEKPEISVEIGQEISGQIIGGLPIRNKPAKDAQINILSMETDFFDITTTDDKGYFTFQHFEFPDSTAYLVQALTKKGSPNVDLVLKDESFPPTENIIVLENINENISGNVDEDKTNDLAYIEKADKRYTIENGMRTVYLNPVEIKGKRTVEGKSFYSRLSDKTFTEEFIRESGAAVISDIMRRVAGIVVQDTNIYSIRSVDINGNMIPVSIFIDDVHMRLFEGQSVDDIINIEDIEEINVLKTVGKTLVLGPSAGPVAIMITTKKGERSRIDSPTNMMKIQPLGYQKPIEFYSPRYDTGDTKTDPNPDLRTTIYWNPSLQSKENGKTHFDFYTADFPGEYTMIIEGITKTGKIVRSVDKLKISDSD